MTPLERLAWLAMVAGLIQGHGPSMIVAVLMAEAAKADDSGSNCWPKVAELVSRSGLKEDAIFRAVKRLEALGVVVVGRRWGHSNYYTLKHQGSLPGDPSLRSDPLCSGGSLESDPLESDPSLCSDPSLKIEDKKKEKKEKTEENRRGNQDLIIEVSSSTAEKKKRFVKPTLEELDLYREQINSAVDVESFLDHYESNGWLVGKVPMKDWKATFRRWTRNQKGSTPAQATCPHPPNSAAWMDWYVTHPEQMAQ